MSKVSIIVPVYQVGRYLCRCLDSLLCQTLTDIEIILVDDGSTDDCPRLCDAYRARDGRVRVIHQANEGLGSARNRGLDIAGGDFVGFVDSDDYAEPDMFERMYEEAFAHGADLVRVDHFRERADDKVTNGTPLPPMREGVYDREGLRRDLLLPMLGLLPGDDGTRYASVSVWRNLYRRSVIEAHHIRFSSERDFVAEDLLFNLAFLLAAERASVINRKLYHYMQNGASLTQTYRADRFEKELLLYRELIARTGAAGLSETCQLRLDRTLLARTRKCIRNEFWGNPGRREAHSRVRAMLKSPELAKVFGRYPYRELPLKYKASFMLMKHKAVGLLRMLRKKL